MLKRSGDIAAEEVDSIKSVWCFAHRLNLATRDLRDVPGMDDIFILANWITSRRVAVSYRKYQKTRFPETRFRKIPTPSETRWLFYRDVISIIHSQYEQIVVFVSQLDWLRDHRDLHTGEVRSIQSKEFFQLGTALSKTVFSLPSFFLKFLEMKM